MALQLIFICLQAADVLTTLVAIALGGSEANILVGRLMHLGVIQGLIFSKVLVLAIATGAVMARKFRVLRVANVVFTGVVLWNVVVIILLLSGV
jgi:hypothetical protein